MKLSRLLKDVAIYGTGTVLSPLVGFLLLPIYTRFLGPEDYGVLAVVSVTVSVLTVLLSLGVPSGMVRIYYDHKAEAQRAKVAYSSLGFLFFITSSAAFVMSLGAVPFSRLLFKQGHGPYLFHLMAWGFATGAWTTGLINLVRAQQRSATYTAVSVGGFTLRLLLNILFVVFLLRGVEGIMEAGVISNLLMTVVLAGVGFWGKRPGFSRRELAKVLNFGIRLVPANAASWTLAMADRYFLQAMTNMHQLGLYSVGYKIGQVAEIGLVKPFRLAWPMLIYQEARDTQAARKSISSTATLYAFVGAWAFVLLHLAGPVVLYLITPSEFHQAGGFVGIIAFSYILLGSVWITGAGLHILKKPTQISWAFMAGALLNLVLNWITVPVWGAMAAAWSTLASYGLVAVWVFVASQRRFPIHYEKKKIGLIVLWTTIIIALSWLFNGFWFKMLLSLLAGTPGLFIYRNKLFGLRRAFVMQKDLNGAASAVNIPEELEIKSIEVPDQLPAIRPNMREDYEKRLSSGTRAFAAFWNGQAAHLSWVSLDGWREKHTGYTVEPGVAYIFDSITLPEFRGRGIYRAVLGYISGFARNMEVKTAKAIVFSDNTGSIRAFEAAGFVKKQALTALKVFGLVFTIRREM